MMTQKVSQGHEVGPGFAQGVSRRDWPPIGPPGVYIHIPANGSHIVRPEGISESAEACDADGTVVRYHTGLVTAAVLNHIRPGGFNYATRNKGGLFEAQAENLCPDSEAFDNWTDAGGASVNANNVTSPDGQKAADKINDAGSGASAYVHRAVAVAVNEPYAVSVFIKKGTSSAITLVLRDTTAPANRTKVDFEFTAGVLSVKAEDVGTGYVEEIGDGWYRAVALIPANTVLAENTHAVWLYPTEEGVNEGAVYVYAWGAQVENETYATMYIPTTAAAVTRSADQLEYAASLLADGAVTIYGRFIPEWNGSSEAANRVVLDTRAADGDDGILLKHDSAAKTIKATVRSGGADVAVLDSTVEVVRGQSYCFALAVDTDDFELRVYDVEAETTGSDTDTAGAIPTEHGQFAVGADKDVGGGLCGVINDVVLYTARHSSAQMTRMLNWLARRAA